MRTRKVGLRRGIVESVIMYSMFVVLFLYAISMLLPLLWMIWTSFKDPIDAILDPFGFPDVWRFENYIETIRQFKVTILKGGRYVTYGIPMMFWNSILYSTLSSAVGLLWPVLTAYIVSKYKFRGGKLIFNIGIIVMIIPIIGTMPAQMRWMKTIGTYDNMIPQILLSGTPFGFNFILLYGQFKAISWSYAEAAFVDGAGHNTVMWRIMFPMMMPTFATLFLLSFISCWNNYQGMIIWMPSYPTLAVGVYSFKENAAMLGLSKPHELAGYIMIAIPTVAIWCASHKMITSKFAVGGLKG